MCPFTLTFITKYTLNLILKWQIFFKLLNPSWCTEQWAKILSPSVKTPNPTSSLKLIFRTVMQIRANTNPKNTCLGTTEGPNSVAIRQQHQPIKHRTTPFDICEAQAGVCILHLKLSLYKRVPLLIVRVKEWQRKQRVDRENRDSRLAHVSHLPLMLRLPVWQIWRGIEVVLKWVEGRLRSVHQTQGD